MKVYLVFQGCYSDKHCVAVFDNEEDAKILEQKIDAFDYACIEECELGEVKPKNLEYTTVYTACIYIKKYLLHNKGEIKEFSDEELFDITNKTEISYWDDLIQVKSCISQEHAKKVAIEQYQIYTQQQLENDEI